MPPANISPVVTTFDGLIEKDSQLLIEDKTPCTQGTEKKATAQTYYKLYWSITETMPSYLRDTFNPILVCIFPDQK